MRHFSKLLIFSLLALPAFAADAKEPDIDAYTRWNPADVEKFAALPIQDGGRVKPVYTLGRVTLLQLLGSRSATIHVPGEGGKVEKIRLSPTEVLMDITFRPEVARQLPLFLVNDSEAVAAIGAEEHQKRRSRYSYAEIIGNTTEIVRNSSQSERWQRLRSLATKYNEIEAQKRNGKQNQTIDLFRNVTVFEGFANELAFLRFDIENYLTEDAPQELRGKGVSDILATIPALRERQLNGDVVDEQDSDLIGLDALMQHAQLYAQRNIRAFSFFAPEEKKATDWTSAIELFDGIFNDFRSDLTENATAKLGQLRLLENLTMTASKSTDIAAPLAALEKEVLAKAEPRGDTEKIGPELQLYDGNYLANSKWVLSLAMALAAIAWLAPSSKFGQGFRMSAMGVTALALGMICFGIYLRCVVTGHPPIGRLYETFIFIAASAVVLGLVFEWVVKNHIALAVGIFSGWTLMFLSELYEQIDATDTMAPLVAVLRSNFWLATHVVIITLGYAAGIFAGILSHVFVFGKLFGWRKGDKKFYRGVTRMVYGVICFTMLFSIIGTILGGIWGNYSWGRFWGWDPKENGALLIVLMNLIIVHAKAGALIRDLGVHVLSIIGGCFVVFSWFYVNNMGVGLHSYGFTSGIVKAVFIFWGTQLFVLACAFVVFLMERSAAAERKTVKEKGPVGEPTTA
ncbi:MAG: cytochrome c biogenesis protein CcsA [Verrucomicrobiota bacterium]